MPKMLDVFGDLLYRAHEWRTEKRFDRKIRRGFLREEPRYRPITGIGENPYAGAPPGSVEHAHIQRYDFASQRISPGLVLNAACGSGYGSEILGRSGSKVVGVDLFREPLRIARTQFGKHLYVRADIVDLGMFVSDRFDAAVSFETIEHITDPHHGIGEMKRLLRPGGSFLGSIPIQILHHPGTNFTFSQAWNLVERHFPGSERFLQDNRRILPFSDASWRTLRFEKDKFLIFHWVKH